MGDTGRPNLFQVPPPMDPKADTGSSKDKDKSPVISSGQPATSSRNPKLKTDSLLAAVQQQALEASSSPIAEREKATLPQEQHKQQQEIKKMPVPTAAQASVPSTRVPVPSVPSRAPFRQQQDTQSRKTADPPDSCMPFITQMAINYDLELPDHPITKVETEESDEKVQLERPVFQTNYLLSDSSAILETAEALEVAIGGSHTAPTQRVPPDSTRKLQAAVSMHPPPPKVPAGQHQTPKIKEVASPKEKSAAKQPPQVPTAESMEQFRMWAVRAAFAARVARHCSEVCMYHYVSMTGDQPHLASVGRDFHELAATITSEVELAFPSLPPGYFNVMLLNDMATMIQSLIARQTSEASAASAASGGRIAAHEGDIRPPEPFRPPVTPMASSPASSSRSPIASTTASLPQSPKQLQYQAKAGMNKILLPTAKGRAAYSQLDHYHKALFKGIVGDYIISKPKGVAAGKKRPEETDVMYLYVVFDPCVVFITCRYIP